MNFKRGFVGFVFALAAAGALIACSGAAESLSSTQVASAEGATAPAGTRTFVIDPSESEARFIINEVLNGSPNTVVGKTNLVQGSIFVSYDNPSITTMSTIEVDLSGLATDSPLRNGMIRRSILETDNPAFRLAQFVMTRLDGLPLKVTIGQPFDFKLTGNLTIHGVSKEATFDVSVTPVSETQLKGKASFTTTHGTFGVDVLRLPPQVASVEDKTILEIEFVANAQ